MTFLDGVNTSIDEALPIHELGGQRRQHGGYAVDGLDLAPCPINSGDTVSLIACLFTTISLFLIHHHACDVFTLRLNSAISYLD